MSDPVLTDDVLTMLLAESRRLDHTDQLQNWIQSYMPNLVAEIRELRKMLHEAAYSSISRCKFCTDFNACDSHRRWFAMAGTQAP